MPIILITFIEMIITDLLVNRAKISFHKILACIYRLEKLPLSLNSIEPKANLCKSAPLCHLAIP
jgi:hypothetical protein